MGKAKEKPKIKNLKFFLILNFKKVKENRTVMNLPNMDLADFQMLAALTNAAAAAQQQQQAAAAFASLTAQQSQASHYSRQSTPPISTTNSPKVSTNNTRTPTPTQNGIPQTSASIGTAPSVSTAGTTARSTTPGATIARSTTPGATPGALDPQSQSKYQQLLSVIEEMSKDIRPTYAGSKSSAERLKRGIVYARILVRDCLMETERSARN